MRESEGQIGRGLTGGGGGVSHDLPSSGVIRTLSASRCPAALGALAGSRAATCPLIDEDGGRRASRPISPPPEATGKLLIGPRAGRGELMVKGESALVVANTRI